MKEIGYLTKIYLIYFRYFVAEGKIIFQKLTRDKVVVDVLLTVYSGILQYYFLNIYCLFVLE